MTKKEERKRSTYRFNKELEAFIIKESTRLGVSKNAYAQIKLTELLNLQLNKKTSDESGVAL